MVASTKNGHELTATDEPRFGISMAQDPGTRRMRSSVDFQIGDFFHAIRRSIRVFLLVLIPIALAIAIATWMNQSPTYKATAMLRLSATGNQLVFDKVEQRADFELYKETQISLVSSRFVMAAALRNPKIADAKILNNQARPVDWMIKNIRVDSPSKTELMLISVEAKQSDEAVNLVNAVVDAYCTKVVNIEQSERQNRLDEIDRAFVEKESEVRRKRSDLKRLAEQLGTSDNEALSAKQEFLIQELGDLRRQLVAVQMRLWGAEAELRTKRIGEAGDGQPLSDEIKVSTADIEAALVGDAIHSELLNDKLKTIRMESEAKSAFKTATEMPYAKLRDAVDEAMLERRAEVEAELHRILPKRLQEMEERNKHDARQLEAQIVVLKELEERIAAEVATLRAEVGQVGNKSIDVEMMRSEIAQLDRVLGSVAQEREELKVELKSRPRVEVLQNADDAEPANLRVRLAVAGMAGLLSFMLPAAVVAGLDLRRNRVNSVRDVALSANLPVFESVPAIPVRAIGHLRNKSNERADRWQVLHAESIKRIVNRLLVARRTNSSGMILVTSAGRAEGKTTLATQLAQCLSDMDRSVVLVDLDLHNPVIHRIFGVGNAPGMCEVLRSELELSGALKSGVNPKLSLLTAGDVCQRAIRQLGCETLSQQMKELRSLAEYVVIDGCAVLPWADMGYVAPNVDGVLFAIRSDVSQLRDILAAEQVLANVGATIMGAVVIEPAQLLVRKKNPSVPARGRG